LIDEPEDGIGKYRFAERSSFKDSVVADWLAGLDALDTEVVMPGELIVLNGGDAEAGNIRLAHKLGNVAFESRRRHRSLCYHLGCEKKFYRECEDDLKGSGEGHQQFSLGRLLGPVENGFRYFAHGIEHTSNLDEGFWEKSCW